MYLRATIGPGTDGSEFRETFREVVSVQTEPSPASGMGRDVLERLTWARARLLEENNDRNA